MKLRAFFRKLAARMIALDGRARAMSAALWARAKGWLTRERAARLGWYAALAALLVALGSASYAYRNRGASGMGTGGETPLAAMAVGTAEPFELPAPAVTPEPTPEPLWFVWPVEGEIVGEYAPDALVWSRTLGQWQTHPAIDIAAAAGEAVAACADGVVADAYSDALWGNVIEIEHRDGYRSVYANLNTLNLVAPGDPVVAGQVISAVGRSAACESDMLWHLHFALTRDGVDVNFEDFMSEQGF